MEAAIRRTASVLQECKEHALKLLDEGDIAGAWRAFAVSMRFEGGPAYTLAIELGEELLRKGCLSTVKLMREFIEGFN